jgi:hypothetical protein
VGVFDPPGDAYDALFPKPVEIDALLRESSRLIKRAMDAIDRTEQLRQALTATIADSKLLAERARELCDVTAEMRRTHRLRRRATISTTRPPTAPPPARCSACDTLLVYRKSHFGGVKSGAQERWDEYYCPEGHGAFEFRHRTRTLRRVV